MNEIRPGFADECRVEINGRPAVTKLVHRAINAEADGVEAGDELEFTLVTPPLCSPAELRGGGDTRRLGLAIQHLVR
jgi:hypothetical protein